MQTKKCVICGTEFPRPKGCSHKVWDRRKCCSVLCRTVWQKENKIGFQPGHKPYNNAYRYPKGHTPWNKGVKGLQTWMNTLGLVKDGSNNRGKKMSKEQRKKLSESHKGKKMPSTRGTKHWNWKGGVTKLYYRIRNMAEYKRWRKSVYEKDNYMCQICGNKNTKLHADHIKPLSHIIHENKIRTTQEAFKCVELWDVSNGRTLCVACHLQTRTYGGRSSK